MNRDKNNYNLDRDNTVAIDNYEESEILISVFSEEKDVQSVLNEMTQAGFDTDQVSLIMKPSESIGSYDKDEEEFVYDSKKLFDEENAFEEAYGMIEPQSAIQIGEISGNTSGSLGIISLTGPLARLVETSDLKADLYSDRPFDPALYDAFLSIGITIEEFEAFEQRLKNGQFILILPLLSEEAKEMQFIIADHGPDFLEIRSTTNNSSLEGILDYEDSAMEDRS